MKSSKAAFLDFYKQHNISPVAQDVSNLNQHFQRRDALYRQCGIVPGFLAGKRILEVGPGTGHNALFTNSLRPAHYTLLDGNPKSCEQTQLNLAQHFTNTDNVHVIEADFLTYDVESHFDLVCCEGAIPWQNDPQNFLARLSEFVGDNGVLLITCSDGLSFFSEILRRLAARLLIAGHDAQARAFTEYAPGELLEALRPFFSAQLSHLPSMSRGVDDWVLDNIIHPVIGEPLSILDAIDTLSAEFDFYGASPTFATDWRWYKAIHGDQRDYTARAKQQFLAQQHNILDFRAVYPEQSVETGQALSTLTEKVMRAIYQLDFDIPEASYAQTLHSVTASVREQLIQLIDMTQTYAPDTAASLADFEQALGVWLAGDNFPQTLTHFSPWYGRGQQYVSFIRRPFYG